MSEDEIENLLTNIAGDFEAPKIEVIHAIAESRRQRRTRGIAVTTIALLAVGIAGIGAWLNEPESTRFSTVGEEESPVDTQVAADSAPVEFDQWDSAGEPFSPQSFAAWMLVNRVSGSNGLVVDLIAVDSDPTINQVRLRLSAFPLDGSFEFFAVLSAECGPRVDHGMLRFEDESAWFASGERPDSENIVFGDLGYDCIPPAPQKLDRVLAGALAITPSERGLRMSSSGEHVDFVVQQRLTAGSEEQTAPANGMRLNPPIVVVNPYLSLSVKEAGALADDFGREWRVISIDGEALFRTQDLRIGRLNFTVVDGIVVDAQTDEEMSGLE